MTNTISTRVREGVTLIFPGAGEPALPDAFGARGWRPQTAVAVQHGRGGAGVIPWVGPELVEAFWRPFRHGGLFGRVLGDRYFSWRPLRREIEDAMRLAEHGVRVARPIVGRAERCGRGFRLGLVAECVQGLTLVDRLDELASSEDWLARRTLLRAAGAAVARLHRAGFSHADLHPGNLFVDDDALDAQQRIVVLDLTGGTWGLEHGGRRALANLVRCARWWHKHRSGYPDLRDVVAFLGAYEAGAAKRHALLRRGRVSLDRALRIRRRG